MKTSKDHMLTKNEFGSIIIGKLMNIGGVLEREGNRLLSPYQLNQQQFSILFEIAKAKEVRQKNMVNRLLLEKAHVSKVVKKLQTMELIDVVPLPEDKRSALLSLTPKGQKIITECQEVFAKWKKECLDHFDDEELTQLLESVEKLQRAFLNKYLKNGIQ
ncbi:MarR family winged helix-turn-helix transcriptional regulator [Sunxiuqinia sp. A32]|uniref:MarR family winged helix-turn-helix transcriptional regulator n=1 Tax=Sunxiuqinia sp. A32 TaxID=3461496 RepID=UPI0040455ECF